MLLEGGLVATCPGPWFLCSRQSWGASAPCISGAFPAWTELPCSLMPQLQAPGGSPPPPAPEKLVPGPGEGPLASACFMVGMGCAPGWL